MKFDWAIWKPSGDTDEVRFVQENDLPNSGFASVYRFTETDAKAMQSLGSFKHFKGTVSGGGLLKIDADTEESSQACERRLQALGLAYQKFTTGNRGNHYHVVRNGAPSHTLPHADKLFVKANFPGCDMSFYHHVGLYRQTGAVHQKTGLRKEMLADVSGLTLELGGQVPEEAVLTPQSSAAGQRVSVFEDAILRCMTVPHRHGERHKRYVEIAVRLDTLNQDPEFAIGYIENVDLMAGGTMPKADIVRMVEWAYYGRAK